MLDEFLATIGQSHLSGCDPQEIQALMKRWEGGPQEAKKLHCSPLGEFEHHGIDADRKMGEEWLSQGKVGCLILAAGLGSRLGFDGPKGCFPVSVVEKKTLYQLLFERIGAIQKRWSCNIPILLLVSSTHQKMTEQFLKNHDYFGLSASQITYAVQHNYPYFDRAGKIVVDDKGKILSAPNGNGGAVEVITPHLAQWKKQGIECLHIIPIDNPLVDPCDPYMTGLLKRRNMDVIVKAIERNDPSESIGVLVEREQKIHVIDYMEMEASSLTGEFRLGNAGHYAVRLDFLLQLSTPLPLHWVEKKVKIGRKKMLVWKGEKFIFDLLPLTTRSCVICYPRALCFAPLKSLKGRHGVAALRRALVARDQVAFEAISGHKVRKKQFELSAEYLHPTADLFTIWQGKEFPSQSYIES